MLIKAKMTQLDTAKKEQLFDLTEDVKGFLTEGDVPNDMRAVATLHTTAVFFTETEEALWDDIAASLRKLVAARA